MRPLKLSSAGMRGIVGPGLTPETAIDFSSAFGTITNGGRIVVAADTRFSSKMLRHSVIAALQGCGCEVIDAGISCAPLVHFAVPELKADGALLIGGGHQGAGWNAIIPIGNNGAYLNSIKLRELFDVYHGRRYLQCPWDKLHPARTLPENIPEKYLDKLCSQLNVAAIAAAGFRIFCDFCNGSGSIMTESLSKRLGISIIPINHLLSGVLPHDPEPRPRSGSQIQSIIEHLQADGGFVFNSDMSRLAVITNKGETLSEEYTLPLGIDYLLNKTTNNERVITNICSSRTSDEVVKKHGGILEKTRVGQSNVIDRMLQTGARFAGEGCGCFTSHDWLPGFDAFYMVGVILEAMAVQDTTLADLAAKLPRYHIVKKTIHCPSAHAYAILRNMRSHFSDAELNEDDGMRFDWKNGWLSLRASTTEQVIRLISEWKDPETAIDCAVQARGLLERMTTL